MKKALSLLLLSSFWVSTALMSQGIIQNGGSIVVGSGAYIKINGTKGNYKSTGNSKISLSPNSYLIVDNHWINDGSSVVFTNNQGKVELTSPSAEIKGNKTTHFPELNLSGNGRVYMFVNTLVGGGYSSGGSGVLRLNNSKLELQGRTLVVNNPKSSAITYNTNGGIVSETNSSSGYGWVQWNIRNGNGGPVFSVPFLNAGGNPVTMQYTVNYQGTQTADSGYISMSTYPTADAPVPNNRPLPVGVFHTENECEGENSERFINRYFIVDDGGYSVSPDVTLDYKYANTDFSGGNDKINENSMGLLWWNSALGKWNYPLTGNLDAANNRISYRAKKNYKGVWTLSDTTPFPRAAFVFSGFCQNDSITFSSQGSTSTDKIVQWVWDFGDGGISTKQKAIHYYSTSGTFDAQLVIRSQSGCFDTTYKKVQIQPSPTAQFIIDDTCENAWVKFESKSWPGAGFLGDQIWEFGDGTPSVKSAKTSHYYGAVGIPDVSLIVFNSKGCKDTMSRQVFIAPQPYAYIDFKNDCQGTPINFTHGSTAGGGNIINKWWDFGNGRRSSNDAESVIYTEFGNFPITFAVENSYGCIDSAISSIEIYPRAIADFQFSPDDNPKMLSDILFTNLSQYDESWDWDFDDGYFTALENPIHQFPNHSTYNVRLISNTQYNCADTIVKPITVKSIPLYWFPEAFTPQNSIGRNDHFGLTTPLTISDYELRIFNRWGQIVFQTSDVNEKWNGEFNGVECVPGQYIYTATFMSPENEIQVHQGTVLLIK